MRTSSAETAAWNWSARTLTFEHDFDIQARRGGSYGLRSAFGAQAAHPVFHARQSVESFGANQRAIASLRGVGDLLHTREQGPVNSS
jgi:hypothetical protein